MAQNGGIIGPVNVTSRGKNTVTTKTSSGDITTQPGTKIANVLVVAGGGGGGGNRGAGGGAGGVLQSSCVSVLGANAYAVTVGAGGATGCGNGSAGANSTGFCLTAVGGGLGKGGNNGAGGSGGSGGGGTNDQPSDPERAGGGRYLWSR